MKAMKIPWPSCIDIFNILVFVPLHFFTQHFSKSRSNVAMRKNKEKDISIIRVHQARNSRARVKHEEP